MFNKGDRVIHIHDPEHEQGTVVVTGEKTSIVRWDDLYLLHPEYNKNLELVNDKS